MFKEYIAEHKNQGTRSKTKIKNDIVKKDLAKEELFKCNTCEYETKKEAALKKHMVSNHEDHECKECKEKLSSFIELMKHVSRLHTKELDRDDNGANEKFREDKEDFKETKGSILNEFI